MAAGSRWWSPAAASARASATLSSRNSTAAARAGARWRSPASGSASRSCGAWPWPSTIRSAWSRPDHGTRVSLGLALGSAEAEPPAHAVPVATRLTGARILIVENDQATADALKRLLQNWDAQVSAYRDLRGRGRGRGGQRRARPPHPRLSPRRRGLRPRRRRLPAQPDPGGLAGHRHHGGLRARDRAPRRRDRGGADAQADQAGAAALPPHLHAHLRRGASATAAEAAPAPGPPPGAPKPWPNRFRLRGGAGGPDPRF